MIEASESQENDDFQLVTLNGDSVINVGDVSVLSGTDNLEVLTLGEAELRTLGLELESCEERIKYIPSTYSVNPPIIEEENSSDNLPAIGHLEGFEIQTADDGTLLPSTVNAKMADGSYQRLTLFPQIVDGNVTCMVHFENEFAQVEEQPAPTTLSEKIDSIICQNEDIIANSKMWRTAKKPKEAPVSLLKSSRVRQADIPRTKKLSPLKGHMSRNSALYFPVKEVIDPSRQYIKLKEKLKKFSAVSQRLQRAAVAPPVSQPSRVKPLEARVSALKTTATPKEKLVNGNNGVQSPPSPAPPSPVVRNDESEKIFIKTTPEFFTAFDNRSTHPLGSTENPITLLQSGQVYHSQQPLSETQLRHISSILKTQKKSSSTDISSNVLIDPATKTRIVYSVVYPEDEKLEEPKPKRIAKRGRTKAPAKESEASEESNIEPKSAENGEPPTETQPSLPPKVMKLPRTRSGRLSRPPRYMVQDYKRLQVSGEVPAKAAEADLYVDYRNAEDDLPPPAAENTTNTSLYLNLRRKKKKNFKSEYRCPTCQKIYLGHGKMMLHLRKFPDHSNMDEYLEIYKRARTERKVRPLNVSKLKQILSGVDRSAYGPLVANAFTLWDFLLVRVSLLHQKGVEEVEALLKELHELLEKLGKVAEELLSPIFEHDLEDADFTFVNLDKVELAYALGLPQGFYKVNTERLHLVRLAKEEPPPPLPPTPRPSQLATKFEPNLSTKLMDCSNDSIDLDCSSKDVEPEDEKKEWASTDKVDDTNSEFLSEFLQNQLPSGAAEGLALWKANNEVTRSSPARGTAEGLNLWKAGSEVAHVSPAHGLPAPPDDPLSLWKESKGAAPSAEELQLWKDSTGGSWKNGESHCTSDTDLWKGADTSSETALVDWRDGPEGERGTWKEEDQATGGEWDKKGEGEGSVWKSTTAPPPANNQTTKDDSWNKSASLSKVVQHGESATDSLWLKTRKNIEPAWEGGSGEKKDWLRQWKEETGMPGLRTARLTSTPETHAAAHGPSALFSPPLRRNSVSSFAPSHQEELLSLDLHDLFEEFIPEQGKTRRPKPSSIESIINEALFTGNEPPPSHASLPPSLIPDTLDEVTNLDFLSQD